MDVTYMYVCVYLEINLFVFLLLLKNILFCFFFLFNIFSLDFVFTIYFCVIFLGISYYKIPCSDLVPIENVVQNKIKKKTI